MRIHGYCGGCRKIKRVLVSGHGWARLAMGMAAEGICDDCAAPRARAEAGESGRTVNPVPRAEKVQILPRP